MKSAYVALKGHLKSGGDLFLVNNREACVKGAIASNKKRAEKKTPYKPPELNWKRSS